MTVKPRKPKSIEAGKCYRLNVFGEASDFVVYVYAIEGRRQRHVRVQTIDGHALGWNYASYTEFLRRVHSEAPAAKN